MSHGKQRLCDQPEPGQGAGMNFSDSSFGSKIAAGWGAECLQGRKSLWHTFPLKTSLEAVCVIQCLKLVWEIGRRWIRKENVGRACVIAWEALWDKRRKFDFIFTGFQNGFRHTLGHSQIYCDRVHRRTESVHGSTLPFVPSVYN